MENFTPKIIGIGEFQKKTSHFLKELKNKKESFLVSHNKPQAVIMSLDRYATLRSLEEESLEEIKEVLSIVEEGNQEFEQGKTIKAKSMRELLD